MEMYQIRYFLAVCDKRNFTRAAESVYVSQPSLTQAIKKLEEELGGELFTRNRSGCRLTSLGQLVEPRLRHVYRDALDTKMEATRFTRLKKTPMRIGVMTTIGAQRLSPFFARYQLEYPDTDLELIVDSEKALFRYLQSGRLDLVISAPLRLPGKPFHKSLLYEERYVVAFNKNHPFTKRDSIDLRAIQSQHYLDRLNCELREVLRSLCTDREIHLYAAYRSSSEEWILHMVRAGIGVALLPEYTLPSQPEDICFHYLMDPEISRRVYAIFLDRGPRKDQIKALASRLEQGV